MKRAGILFFLLSFLLIMLALPVQAQDGPSGELIIALPNDPTSLYVPNAADRTAANAAWPLYDPLVFVDNDGVLVPKLAESWEISEDGTAYTFNLRQGVTFHNGESFDAGDVIATWQFGQTEGNTYTGAYLDAVSVEAVDDFTVRITTAEPNPLFMTASIANNWAIVPEDYINEVGIEGFQEAPVGTGPFRFVERAAGDRIVYDANLDYWDDGLPKLERVVYRIIPDSTTRLAAVQTGEVHIANRLSIDEVGVLDGANNVEILSYPTDRVYYVAFKNIGNGVGSPVEDQLVRQALNYAVNKQGIINAIFGGEANLITGFVVESNLGFDSSITPYPYDPERAQELLAEAGFGEGFEISMGCPTDAYLNINEVCLAIQRDLTNIGIDASVEFRTSNSYWSAPQYGNVGPMYVDSWSSDIGEALNRLEGALTPGATFNGWEDEDLFALIEEIGVTVDREERAALYRDLQQRMYEDPPFIYLYQPTAFEAVNTAVAGYQPRAAEDFFLNDVSLSS